MVWPMSVESLLLESFDVCVKHDIGISLYPRKKLPNGCGGEFGEPEGGKPGNLKVAIGHRDGKHDSLWLELYVHEYCHCLQWINKDPEYIASEGALNRFFGWLDKEAGRKLLMKDVYTIQKMESYCDRKAVKLIKKHGLDIDIERYIKGSNIYMVFYMAVAENRSWVKKGKMFPYTVKELLELMPSKFMPMSYYRKLPLEVSELFDKYCF